jgi:hypothetical protein
MKFLIIHFSPAFCYVILLRPKYCHQHLFSNPVSQSSSLGVKYQVSHPQKIAGKIKVCIFQFLCFYVIDRKTKDSELNDSKHSSNSNLFFIFSLMQFSWWPLLGTSSLSIWPNWVGSTRRQRQNPISETLYVLNKSRIMDNVQKQSKYISFGLSFPNIWTLPHFLRLWYPSLYYGFVLHLGDKTSTYIFSSSEL